MKLTSSLIAGKSLVGFWFYDTQVGQYIFTATVLVISSLILMTVSMEWMDGANQYMEKFGLDSSWDLWDYKKCIS